MNELHVNRGHAAGFLMGVTFLLSSVLTASGAAYAAEVEPPRMDTKATRVLIE